MLCEFAKLYDLYFPIEYMTFPHQYQNHVVEMCSQGIPARHHSLDSSQMCIMHSIFPVAHNFFHEIFVCYFIFIQLFTVFIFIILFVLSLYILLISKDSASVIRIEF